MTAERSEDGVSASVSWTAYAGGDFSYYRLIVCSDAQYDGSSCSGTVYKSDPVYDAASTGPLSVTGLDPQTGYGVILQTWRTGSAAHKSHAAIPARPAPRGIIVQDADGNALTALSVPEGGEASYQVKLASQPAEDVEVCVALAVRGNDDPDITFKGEAADVVSIKLTFTSGDWNTAQTVTLTAAYDADTANGARDVTHDARDYYAGHVDLTATEADNLTIPAAPSGLTAAAAVAAVTLAWNAPGGPLTGYQYRVNHNDTSTGNLSGWGPWQSIDDAAAASHTLDGLTNGREYRFKLRALNAAGPGAIAPAAAPWFVAATPVAPAAPSNFTVTNGDGYYDLDWDAVGGATGYDVRAKVANSNSWTSVATGLTDTSYRYTTSDVVNVLAVRAASTGGPGPWAELSRMPSDDWLRTVIQGGASAQSVQAQSQLAAPASITVTRDNYPEDEKLNVSWAAVTGAGGYNLACAASPPSNTPLSSVSWWHCGSVDSGSTTTFTVDKDKRDGRDQDLSIWRSYAVAVRAVISNPAQASPWLMSADAHPARVPEDISVSRATGSVSVSWTPPNHAQGYEIECAAYDLTETPQGPPPNEPSYTLCADVETATVTNGKIDVTISSWTAGGTDYTVDDAKTYDLKVRTTNDWGESPDALAPLIYPADMLTVSNIGATTATLNIAHYSGNWYYKADKSPDRTCRGPVNGSTKDLTGLTAYTDYVYSAYSNSRCSAFRLLDTASFTTLPSISNLTNTVAGDADITRTTGQAIAFTTGANPGGYALKTLTAKLKKKGSPTGTLRARLYQMQGSGPYTKDSEPSSTILATLTGTPPTSTSWTDTDFSCSGSGCQLDPNTTYFIQFDNNDGSAGSANVWAWAYTLSGSETKAPTNNGWDIQFGHTYLGGGSWQSYEDWLVAEIAFATNPSLSASNVATTTATLTIAHHGGGAWYYQHTNAGATCDGPVAAGTSTKDLTGLTAGTSYTFSAYTDSACTTANRIAAAAQFTTPSLTVSNVGTTTARITVGGHTGQWSYKADTGPHTTCQSPVNAGTAYKDLTSLTAGGFYVYTAYSASGCASGNALASAAVSTAVTASNLGQSTTNTLHPIDAYGQGFTTGNADATLLSATVQFGDAFGSVNATVSLRAAQSNGKPATTDRATLSGTPVKGQQSTFTCSDGGSNDCSLDANTKYFIYVSGSSGYLASTASNTETLQPAGNGWSIEDAMRRQTSFDLLGSGYAMKIEVEAVPHEELTASSVTATGATLTLNRHVGAWYYKSTTTGQTTCTSAGNVTSVSLTLTAGTSYTFSAYSDSTCTTGNLLATAAQFTTLIASPSGVTASASKGGVSVTWTATGVDKAQVRTRTSGGQWSAAVDPVVNADASPARIIGLTPGTAVDVQLRTVKGDNHSAWVNAGTSITPQAVTAPSGQAQNVSVNYANNKIWIRFDFPTDDGGQVLSYRLRIDTGGNNINLNEAETDAEVGTEADKTYNDTTYDVVYSFDRWRHPWVFNGDWRSICESGRNFHVKTVSITVSNASGNSGLREVTLSPYVYSGCD